MPVVTLNKTLFATTSQSQPNYTSDDLHFVCSVVGTAGAPVGTFVGGSFPSSDSTSQYCHGWFGWNLADLPAGATITNATLSLTNCWNNSNLTYGGIDVTLSFYDAHQILENGIIFWNGGFGTVVLKLILLTIRRGIGIAKQIHKPLILLILRRCVKVGMP